MDEHIIPQDAREGQEIGDLVLNAARKRPLKS